jgi:hypothetical protein
VELLPSLGKLEQSLMMGVISEQERHVYQYDKLQPLCFVQFFREKMKGFHDLDQRMAGV